VREAVEIEVVDETVKADRNACATSRIVVHNAVVQREDLPSEVHTSLGLGIGNPVDTHTKIVELQHLDLRAEGSRQQGEVGRDVKHARVDVPHNPCRA